MESQLQPYNGMQSDVAFGHAADAKRYAISKHLTRTK